MISSFNLTDSSMGVISVASGIPLLALVYFYPQAFLPTIPGWAIKCFALPLIIGGFLIAFFPAEPSEAHLRIPASANSSIGVACMAAGIYLLARVFFYPQRFLPRIPRWAIKCDALFLIVTGFLFAFWHLLLKLVLSRP